MNSKILYINKWTQKLEFGAGEVDFVVFLKNLKVGNDPLELQQSPVPEQFNIALQLLILSPGPVSVNFSQIITAIYLLLDFQVQFAWAYPCKHLDNFDPVYMIQQIILPGKWQRGQPLVPYPRVSVLMNLSKKNWKQQN